MMNLCFLSDSKGKNLLGRRELLFVFLSPALKFRVDRNAFVCYHTNML